jgi:hypothetical protein
MVVAIVRKFINNIMRFWFTLRRGGSVRKNLSIIAVVLMTFLLSVSFASAAVNQSVNITTPATNYTLLNSSYVINVSFNGTANITLRLQNSSGWSTINSSSNQSSPYTYTFDTTTQADTFRTINLTAIVVNSTNMSDNQSLTRSLLTIDNNAPVLLSNTTNVSGVDFGNPVLVSTQWSESSLNGSNNLTCLLYVGGVLNNTINSTGTWCNFSHTTSLAHYPRIVYSVVATDVFGRTATSNNMTVSVNYACGSTLTTNTVLQQDITGCAANGLLLGANDITLNCGGYTINGSVAGIGLLLNSVTNVTVTNCTFRNFATGALVNNSNATLTRNSIFNNSGFNIVERVTSNVTLASNYWGHSACPLYAYQVDTNSTSLIDVSPVDSAGAASASTDCSDESVFASFSAVTLYEGDGTSALSNQGSGATWYINSTGDNVSLSSLTVAGVTPWRIYQTYLSPGDDIVFDVAMNPANFRFATFTLVSSTLNGTQVLTSLNTTGVNSTNGTYKFNVTGWGINTSNTLVNGSASPRVISMQLIVTDALGASRVLLLNGVYNFSVQSLVPTLGGDTSNWTDFSDPSSASGVVFHLPDTGRIAFNSPIDLTDQSVVTGLLNLGSLLTIDNGSIGLNSSALGALNVSANLTFYNVSVYTGFNKSLLNTSNVSSFLSVDGAACTAPRCTNMNYSNTSDTFNVTVSQWSTYAIDVTPPTISSPGPSGTQSGSSVTLTATTNEDASCKYSTTDQGYSSMSLTMDGAVATSHTKSFISLSKH